MLQSLAQQCLETVVYVVVIVQNSLETLLQFVSEAFANSIASEVYVKTI